MKPKLFQTIILITFSCNICAGSIESSISSPKEMGSSLIDVSLILDELSENSLSSSAQDPEKVQENIVGQCGSPSQNQSVGTPFGVVKEITVNKCTPPANQEKNTNQETSSTIQILPPVDTQIVQCPPDTENEGYVINFSDINFEEYLHFLSKLTNTNFVYNSEDIQFNISIMADEPTNIKEIRSALLQILRVQGLSMVEEGNNIIISQDPSLRSVGSVVSEEMGNICESNEPFITRVFYLRNTSPTKVAQIVTAMVSTSAIVEPSEDTHHLIVTDLSSNIEGVADLLKSLDNPDAAFEIGTYKSQKTYILNLVTLAEKIIAPLIDGNPLVMVPQEKSSTIFVVSTPYLVRKTLEVLQTLDAGDQPEPIPDGHEAAAEFFIYKLQYHKGEQIQETLKEVAGDLSHMGSVNSQLLMTINSAQWIETTNSLLFIGSAQNLTKIKDLLTIVDAPLRQVFIEVLAVRTTISNSLELGVQYGYRGKPTERVSAAGSLLTTGNPNVAGSAAKPNIFTQGLDAVTGPGVPVPQTPNALGLTTGVIGNVLFKGGNLYFDLAALITALQTDTATDVLTNPKLVTQDTVPATFYVGSTRPFQTNSILQASGSTSGNFVTASIEYRQLGLSLTVTPYLGGGDTITLEIQQSTSDFVDNAVPSSGGNSDNFAIVPVTNDSSITTRVHIPNKHFLMISGMLEDIKTRSKTAIPCLGGIPLIGDLLGVKANSISKDNFIMFIRPQIIDSIEELDSVTSREDQLFRAKSKEKSFVNNTEKLYFLNK
ncbi:MAG: putative secretin GspD [Chlamydiae bacterium]|nr:putative secretin GspD [Chlamydiota bacterium]